ncbi:DinB family protein [Mucilaginibacter sp. AW1-3]
MNKALETIRQTRKATLDYVKDLTIEQLNHIPDGFNNNIAWNLGHMVAAQQGVCYKRSGNTPMHITDEFFMRFKPESKPERFITQEEIDQIKTLMFSTIDQLEVDYQHQIFGTHTPWTTRYGVQIGNLDEAINFLPFHEGLHFGYIMALKRAVIATADESKLMEP